MKKLLCILSLAFSCYAMEEDKYPHKLVPTQITSGYLQNYSEEQKEQINQDLNASMVRIINKTVEKDKQYVGTAGGPGSSKSTILYEYVKNHPGFVHLDFDQGILRYMSLYQNYFNLLGFKNKSKDEILKDAYLNCRLASMYIGDMILNEAGKLGYNIARAITASHKKIGEFYEMLKKNGYSIKQLLCFSPDQNRLNALKHRLENQSFYQVMDQQIQESSDGFYNNMPVYFQYANEMEFLFIDNYKEEPKLAAKWSKKDGIKILDQNAMESIIKLYKEKTQKDLNDLLNTQ